MIVFNQSKHSSTSWDINSEPKDCGFESTPHMFYHKNILIRWFGVIIQVISYSCHNSFETTWRPNHSQGLGGFKQ